MKLSGKRYEEIKKIAAQIIVKYHGPCVPINGFDLANNMGITIIPYTSYPFQTKKLMMKLQEDGFFIEKDDGQIIIYYDNFKIHNSGRINFTILHEIGHVVLNHSQESDLAEAEANFFAKYIIAPPPLIHELKLNSPEEIQSTFKTSEEVASYAYDYYNTRIEYGSNRLTDYEEEIIEHYRYAGE